MTDEPHPPTTPELRVGRRRLPGRRLPASLVLAGLLVLGGLALVASGREPDYAVDCLAVGAHVDDAEGGKGTEAFLEARDALGPLSIHRTFDQVLPSSFEESSAASDPAAGVRSFVSWKPPGGDHAAVARGEYDEEVAAWARSLPGGIHATAFHEPENDMTGAQFVAMQRHLYRVVKEANPEVRWGPVYMAYWWDPAKPEHYVGDPRAWWPGSGYADFAGLDWYGTEPRPMTSSPSFLHWYETMLPTGLPLLITEYGQYALRPGDDADPRLQQLRAEAIRADAAWIRDHPRIRMWMYWQDDGRQGDWRMTDEASQNAWRAVAEHGCRP